jgi:hypothetical protein
MILDEYVSTPPEKTDLPDKNQEFAVRADKDTILLTESAKDIHTKQYSSNRTAIDLQKIKTSSREPTQLTLAPNPAKCCCNCHIEPNLSNHMLSRNLEDLLPVNTS